MNLMNAFESLLEKLESQGIEINILGDVNCDVSATSCDHRTSRLLEICNERLFFGSYCVAKHHRVL